MKYKPGVSIRKLQPQIVLALMEIERLYADLDQDLVITSGDDGKHSDASLHYEGLAIDIRTRNLTLMTPEGIAQAIREVLPEGYDVIVESTHIHLEYDPA